MASLVSKQFIITSHMFKIFLLLVALLLQAQARYFETALKFTLFARNKGWVYLDKMTFAPGTASVEFDTHITGLPFGKNAEIFLVAIS